MDKQYHIFRFGARVGRTAHRLRVMVPWMGPRFRLRRANGFTGRHVAARKPLRQHFDSGPPLHAVEPGPAGVLKH